MVYGSSAAIKSPRVKEFIMLALLACLALNSDATEWQKLEAIHLKNIRQLTKDFVRAGEGYFSPDMKQIIFQAEEKDTGNPFYQIFVMDLDTGKYRRVSPGIGRTTCSYFSPDGKKIIFASSHLDPEPQKHYAAELAQRAEDKRLGRRRRYQWDFDPYMEIFEANPDGTGLKRLTDSPGYDAEGSYSADGKQIVFCSQRDGNLELYIMDAAGQNVRKLTNAPGCYNGGPFFSPDGKRVIFRSDRKKKDHLQLYVINVDGTGERALTDNLDWVYWAPYWYKDSKHIVFTAADHSNPAARPNYDLWWMKVATGEKVRLTYAPGQDVLPVFSPDGTKLMWTSTRDGRQPAQLYMADFVVPTHGTK
jgi:Tol biopolymer transport system component